VEINEINILILREKKYYKKREVLRAIFLCGQGGLLIKMINPIKNLICIKL